MTDVAQRRAADRWFLERGTARGASAGGPGAAAVAAIGARAGGVRGVHGSTPSSSLLVTGKHTIDIDGQPTRTEWFVLALLVLVLPVAATVGWLVSRIRSVRGRTLAATVSVGVADRRWHPRRPEPADTRQSRVRGHRDRDRVGADRVRAWARSWAGPCGDAWRTSLRRRAVRARAAGRAADGPGVLQHLRVADGVDRQPRPAVAGTAVPRVDRRRVHHLGHRGPGAADVVGDPASPRRRRPAGRHAVRDDARPGVGRSVVPARTLNVVFVLALSQVLQVGDGGDRRRPDLLRARPDPAQPGVAGGSGRATAPATARSWA